MDNEKRFNGHIKGFSILLIGFLLVGFLMPNVSAAPTASRDLPSSAGAGDSITVSLALTVVGADGITGLIVSDIVPSGWTVTSSSPTYNSFTALTGEVKWVLYGGTLITQTITYDVTIPSSETTGDKTFSGTLSYVLSGNQVDDISGDTSMSVTGAAVTTTSILTTTTIPLVSVDRDIPSIAAGECGDVELEVTLGDTTGITGAIVKEYVPSADWDVTDTDPAADSYTASTGEIKWVLYGPTFISQTLTYTVCAPDDATGDEEFSGTFLYNDAAGDPVTEVIGGDTEVSEESGTTRRRRYMIMTLTGGEEAGDVVTITITDKNTEDPLDEVDIDVYLNGKKLFSELTDDDGIVEFTPTELGTYLITADITRYRDEEMEIVVGGEPVTTVPETTVTETTVTETTAPETTVTETTVEETTVPETTVTETTVTETTAPETTVAPTTVPAEGAPPVPMWLIVLIVLIVIIVIIYFVTKGGKGAAAPKPEEKKANGAANGKKKAE